VIPREDILGIATEKGLLPNVVEKDYVLGWLLMGIARHSLLRHWVFKGGTCLKKCFFETYRFSEDLDFTIPQSLVYEADAYHDALLECVAGISEETGIYFPESGIEINESHDKSDRKTFTGKVSYRGPLMQQAKTLPRIKLDLTKHEEIVESPRMRPIHHFYSDAPDPPVSILCYTENEILAEKTRALYERQGRARDVYDVVNIVRNHREGIDPQRALLVLEKKFLFKSLELPSLDNFFGVIDFATLEANWDHQLKRQLPVLPPAQSYLDELRGSSLLWIEGKPIVENLERVPVGAGEELVPKTPFPQMSRISVPKVKQRGRGAVGFSGTSDRIRYAARNRLCVEITYHGIPRLTEPYSFRIPNTGNLLLYVHERMRGGSPTGRTKAYKVSEIQSARVTDLLFQPRFMVEL
jgi:predicted nucleotidyltransferase component of viral defense system